MNILLIARHYPPEISGGARRPFLLTEALRTQGHKVTIVTPFKLNDKDHICVHNKSINNGLRVQTKVGGAPKVSILGKLKKNARQWVFWPDADIRWARDVVKVVESTKLSLDWIITTSPPESSHIAGALLTRSLGVPWLVEMRDTWISMPHRVILERSKFRAFVERRIANKALKQAAAITSVSEAVMQEARIYCSPNTPELILPHFSKPMSDIDAALFKGKIKFKKADLNIVHTGGFSCSDRRRTLKPLIKALIPLNKKRPELILHIVGPLTQEELAMILATPVRIVHHGHVPIEQARLMQVQADGLLICTPPDSHALPGKYAEYALTGNPILYFGGGSWLSLVDDKIVLRPLVSGLEDLKKGEKSKAINALTHLMAATLLTQFLNTINKS